MGTQTVKKVLICSLGSIGKRHLKIIKEFDSSIEVGLLRTGSQIKNINKDLLDFITHDIYKAINWSPQAAIICSPASFHLEQSLLLAQNSIPLLIEKPLGNGDEKKDDFLKLVKISKNLPILCGYTLRHNDHINLAKELINKRELGKIIEADFHCGSWLPDWRKSQKYEQTVSEYKLLGVCVLLELSHEIDLSNFFFCPLEIISSYLINTNLLNIDVEDNAVVIAKNQENILITFKIKFLQFSRERVINIRGEKGN